MNRTWSNKTAHEAKTRTANYMEQQQEEHMEQQEV